MRAETAQTYSIAAAPADSMLCLGQPEKAIPLIEQTLQLGSSGPEAGRPTP